MHVCSYISWKQVLQYKVTATTPEAYVTYNYLLLHTQDYHAKGLQNLLI